MRACVSVTSAASGTGPCLSGLWRLAASFRGVFKGASGSFNRRREEGADGLVCCGQSTLRFVDRREPNDRSVRGRVLPSGAGLGDDSVESLADAPATRCLRAAAEPQNVVG